MDRLIMFAQTWTEFVSLKSSNYSKGAQCSCILFWQPKLQTLQIG